MESAAEPHRLGYKRVDGATNVDFLVSSMDATSAWDATRELRAWEAERLALREGERLLDVGCGPGDAAIALAGELGRSGEVVGVDVSAAMLEVARARAQRARCGERCRFVVGDALALGEPDAQFDAVRSERTLQWVDQPQKAVAEMARVLRPGGRISLIDTDWSTLRLDVGDDRISAGVREALRSERNRPSQVGSRLLGLVHDSGFGDIAATAATQVWTRWHPDESPTPDGCFSMGSLADDLVAAEQLDDDERDRFIETIHDAARSGRFLMTLTLFAVAGTRDAAT